MTIPEERTRALLETRTLLQELLDSKQSPGVPSEVRQQARVLLRHYPDDSALRLANLALPHLFAPVPSQGHPRSSQGSAAGAAPGGEAEG